MTYAEQFVKAKNENNEEAYRRLIVETEEAWDTNFWYLVFPDGSVYEHNLCVTYTAEGIINAAPDCLYDQNGEENELQKWLLDTVKSRIGNQRVILDKSRVPVEKRDDPRLLEIEKAHDLAMQDPSFRLHVCLHEIGHAVYMERLGAKKLTFHPALVWYHAQTDTFDVGNMAVQGDFGEEVIVADLRPIARWYVAGGVVQHTLAVSPLNIDSDGQDFETFTAMAQEQGATSEDIQEHWDKAKEDVRRDLRSPAFRRELWSRAKSLEQVMFGDTGASKGVYEYEVKS